MKHVRQAVGLRRSADRALTPLPPLEDVSVRVIFTICATADRPGCDSDDLLERVDIVDIGKKSVILEGAGGMPASACA
jgi:hypothetical protein